MHRRMRYCPVGYPVHIVQRGNNRSSCFRSNRDMATYIAYLQEASSKYDSDIHAWVLMTNHVHLLVTPRSDKAVSRMMQFVGSRYVRYFNKVYSRTGTLWEGRFRSCLVQAESYFLACQRYIELNPVRAGLVEHPVHYHWSSYQSNALGIGSNLIRPHAIYKGLGANEKQRLKVYRELFNDAVDQDLVDTIRFAANKGLVLGSENFIHEIEASSGLPARPRKPGPRPRSRQ